jgi:phenylacetate-coenzyme A ligase PaaK-like adenylate-forming protein
MSDYEDLRRRHSNYETALSARMIGQLDWSPERLQAHRTARLRELVGVAVSRSAWHRSRLQHFDRDQLDETSLRALPVMTRDDLMAHFNGIVTDRRLRRRVVETHLERLTHDAYLFDRYHAIASGGSSGRRGVFVYDWDAWALGFLGMLRYERRAHGLDGPACPEPVTMAVLAAGNASHGSSAIFQTFSNPRLQLHAFPVSLPIDDIVAGLNRLRPAVLSGYPSVLHALTYRADCGDLSIRPTRLVTYAEPLLPEIRMALEQTWQVPVCNWWCTSEACAMAVSCGYGSGMHLSEDLTIIEPVDELGRPVGIGQRSAKIYLTNLFNHVLPLIRYEITDQMTLVGEACPCGSVQRLIADVQGRMDDSFDYAGLVVHPHVFRTSLGRQRNIVEYQVSQTARGAAIRVNCDGAVDHVALEAEIAGALSRLGLASPEISITTSDRIERNGTGKLKRFVPLGGRAESGS